MNRPKKLLLNSLLAATLLHATPNCQQIYKVQSFAQRFYAEVLGRQPDNAGLDSWTNALTSRTKTGADVANGFIFSQEFINKHTSDDAFMTTLYKAFFNRNPDPDGFAYWKTKLAEGMSREEVSHGFIYSSEFANLSSEYGIQAYEGAAFSSVALDNFVKRFYSVILGRDADAGGLAYWTGLLSTGAGTGAEIAKGFIFSPEYNIESKTNTQYLNDLYSAFFDRAADTAGFESWMTQLNSGTSRAEVLDGFLGSQEFINLTNSYGILAFKGAPAPDTSGNVAPVAEAGEDMTLSYGEAIHLDGSQSTDADGSLACYWWATPYEILSETKTYTSYGTIGAGRYNIRLTVVDDAGVSSSDSVQITITDMNDTPLTFTSNNSVTVSENQTFATRVVVADAEGGVNYSISGGDSALFTIDATTGVVTFLTAPNFEIRNTYSFTVTATDSAGHTATQEVSIHIADLPEGAVKKTGQTKSYNKDGAIVTDNSIKDDGFYQKGTDPNYTRDDETETVTDHTTGLEWQDDTEAGVVTETLADAQKYCSTLSLDGEGWRLPTRVELATLIDYEHTNPSINPIFDNIVSDRYWSSTPFTNQDYTWFIYFKDGFQDYDSKSIKHYVRCVR